MHGNVAEWCLSTYRPYPYRAGRRPRRRQPAGAEGRPRRFLERNPEVRHIRIPLAVRAVQARLQRRLPRPVRSRRPAYRRRAAALP